MSSGARQVVAAILARWRAIQAGGYSLTLGDDSVKLGLAYVPVRVPMVYLSVGRVVTERGPELGRWTRTLQLQAIGYVGAPEGERELVALDLADDLMRALEMDPSLGLARTLHGIDLSIDGDAFDGAEQGIEGLGICALVINVSWYCDGGM